jgi:hypothetical protein
VSFYYSNNVRQQQLVNADCAQEFDISSADAIEPGTVMVINQTGNLEQSHQPYDKRLQV